MNQFKKSALIAIALAALGANVASAASFGGQAARDVYTDGANWATGARDVYTDGANATGKRDPYTDGARMTRDTYTDGAHAMGTRDPYTDGGNQ